MEVSMEPRIPTVSSLLDMEPITEPVSLRVLVNMEDMDSVKKLLGLEWEQDSWEELLLELLEPSLPWGCITDTCSTDCCMEDWGTTHGTTTTTITTIIVGEAVLHSLIVSGVSVNVIEDSTRDGVVVPVTITPSVQDQPTLIHLWPVETMENVRRLTTI